MPPVSNPSISKTLIDLDEKKGQFVITCPIWDNGRVRSLPNRRWQKSRNAWTAPAIRANIEEIIKVYKGSARITPAALAKIESFQQQKGARVRPRAFPAFYRFKRDPRSKQREALEQTYGLHAAALFMDMRTGKTKVLIDEACALRIEDRVRAVILICPLSLRKNWVREFGKDATIPVDYHLLNTKDKGKAFSRWLQQPHDFKWLLVGVESLAAGSAIEYVKRFALANPHVMCAVDESSLIKTHNATRSGNVVDIGRMVDFRRILTGTPLTKNPLDLYMQFEFLDPDIIGLGDYFSFQARYTVKGGFNGKEIIGYDNLDELVELVSPYTFQVRQSEVIDAAKVYVVREVELSAPQKALYSDLRKRSRLGAEGEPQLIVQNVLEKMLRLQEVTGGHVSYMYTDEEIARQREIWGLSKKLPRTYRQPIEGTNPKVTELLACAEEYEGPMIVWCAFLEEIRAVADALRAKYGQDQVVELHGAVDEAQRDVNVYELFQKRKARFCVGNAATGGMGLTMDEATTIVYYSNTFKFADRMQSEERGTAAGKSTLIVDLIARGTTDEVIMAANEVKLDLSEFIRGRITEIQSAASRGRVEDVMETLTPDAP